ncbi:MAG: Cys-Gln thioester bond-forming surface protein, partial [Sphaerospermopsis sp. SIO1G2]|nr:Cys-Gln thioester bond-forming surface protein [Sphaerospermopsis sp. SIO1G2]
MSTTNTGSDLPRLYTSLPTEVTFDFSTKLHREANNIAEFGEDSYFDVEVTGNSILAGSFDGYCIDTDRGIPSTGTLTAKVYSTYEPLPDELIGLSTIPGAPPGFGNIEKPENLDLVNWILNQSFVDKELLDESNNSLGNVTYGDIQKAIWGLIDDNDTPVSGDVPFNQARVDRIQALATELGEGFVPSYEYTTYFGEQVTGQVGVILAPDTNPNDSVPFDRQILIIGVPLAKLGDRVFEDSNANGIQDVGENGIAGATVNLLADVDGDGVIESGEVVDTTTTDANGNYHFTVLPGDYQVQFETPDGFTESSPANPAITGNPADATDSDAGVGGVTETITIAAGEENPTIDAGFYNLASLGDFVFNDENQDGVQNNGEPGIPDAVVKLLDGNGNPVLDG